MACMKTTVMWRMSITRQWKDGAWKAGGAGGAVSEMLMVSCMHFERMVLDVMLWDQGLNCVRLGGILLGVLKHFWGLLRFMGMGTGMIDAIYPPFF
jgi:hypothetical protein